jgi:hypothetical protein
MIVSPLVQSDFNQKAYADGLTQENLPPASVGNRQASLFVKVNPPILVSGSKQDTFMQFRLFDANNNQTIQHVTYDLSVYRGASGSSSSSTDNNNKPLLRDFFHAHNGLLTLRIQPAQGPITIYGEQDPILNAWVADPGGTINIRGPLLLQGGLYHFHVEIFTIDNDRSLFMPQQAPKFDSYLSVGDVYDNKWNYQNHNYNTTLISYYDKINGNVNFNSANKAFSWSMPFNWNLTRIKQQPIFVHEEMRLPKNWKGVGNNTQFNALVDGQPLSGRSLAIDPFSFPNAMVVHYLINKNDIINLAQKVAANVSVGATTTGAAANNNNNAKGGASAATTAAKTTTNTTGLMRFSLSPLSTATTQIATSSDLVTNTGGIHAAVSWSPNPLKPKTQSTIKIAFYDPVTSTPLSTNNIKYDMIILDKNGGHPVITKQNLIAKNAADTQIVTFPSNAIYQVQLQIKGLLKPGQTPDLTRNGIARGYVVVPEFPNAMTTIPLVGGLSLLFAIVIIRKNCK